MRGANYFTDIAEACTLAVVKARATGLRHRVEVCPEHGHRRGWPLHFRVRSVLEPLGLPRSEPPC